MKTRFGERLKFAITTSGVTQAEVARLAQIGASHLSDILSEKSVEITAMTIVRLCTVTGISSDWLLGLRDDNAPSKSSIKTRIASVGAVFRREVERDLPVDARYLASQGKGRGRAKRGQKGPRSVLVPPAEEPGERSEEVGK